MKGSQVLTLFFVFVLLSGGVFVSAGSFGDWWKGLFTGKVVEEDLALEGEVAVEADVIVEESLEPIVVIEPPVVEPTSLLDAVSDPFLEALFLAEINRVDVKKDIVIKDFIGTFGSVNNFEGEKAFMEAISSKKKRELTTKDFASKFAEAGDQGMRDEFLGNSEPKEVVEEERGFFGWLKRLFS